MSRVIFIIVLASAFAGCGTKEKESAVKSESTSQPKDSTAAVAQPSGYTYRIIPAAENTFGYDIHRDTALFIHQPHVPGMPGIKGFASESQAKKAAELMIEKINKGIVPPTLSEEEVNAILEQK